jgi:hypothetical protein
MAELLVMALTKGDIENGGHGKGDIIEIRDDGKWSAPWHGLPNFVCVKVPEISLAQMEQYIQQYNKILDYEVISSNPNGMRIRVFATNPNVSGKGVLTRQQVETFINKYNGLVKRVDPNSIQFDIGYFESNTSNGYWMRDVSTYTFAKMSNDGVTMRIQVDSPVPWTLKQLSKIKGIIEDHAGTLIATTIDTLTYDTPTNSGIQKFKEDAKMHLAEMIFRKRYYVTPADVDVVISEGGIKTITQAVFLNRIIDRYAE